VVVYIGTLSKAFAPGLRVGWVTGPPPFVERLAALRRTVDRQGDAVGEAAVSALLGDGSLQRHTRRMYRIYAGRRQRVVRLLRELFPQHPVRVPPGGLAVWLQTGSTPLGPWLAAARAREVYVASHETFQHRPGVGEPGLRIGFSALDEEELEEALWRLALARPWKLDP
jgi:GntR family transcriptional regulator/MocR family aminotransferase